MWFIITLTFLIDCCGQCGLVCVGVSWLLGDKVFCSIYIFERSDLQYLYTCVYHLASKRYTINVQRNVNYYEIECCSGRTGKHWRKFSWCEEWSWNTCHGLLSLPVLEVDHSFSFKSSVSSGCEKEENGDTEDECP